MAKAFNLSKFKADQKAKAVGPAAVTPPKKKKRKNATSTEHLTGAVLNGWRQRARRDRIAYSLKSAELEAIWVAQKGLCSVTARPLNLTKNDPCRVSLDRVDPSKAYTLDNVRLVCTSVNYARHVLTDDDLRKLLKDMQWVDRLRQARDQWRGSGNWYTDGVLRPEWERVFGRKEIDPAGVAGG